jgi:hypothetical protein
MRLEWKFIYGAAAYFVVIDSKVKRPYILLGKIDRRGLAEMKGFITVTQNGKVSANFF